MHPSADRVEHPALVVDYALCRVIRHGAPAQGVHGDQRPAARQGPERVGDLRPVQRLGGRGQDLVVTREYRLLGDVRPLDMHPVVLKNDLPAGVVGAHDQVRQRAANRPMVGAERDLGDLAQPPAQRYLPIAQVFIGRNVHCDGEHRGERARDDAFLDDQCVRLVRGFVPQVDQAGDRGPDQRVCPGNTVAEAHVPREHVRVVSEREHVAVPGEPVPEPVRHRQPQLTGAEQDLGGPEGPRGQDHNVSEHRPRCALARHVVGDPPVALVPLHGPHRHLGEDVRAVPVRIGQVVHQDRVLRTVVAAGTAVAAQRARVLPHAGGIRAVREGDVDVGAGYLAAHARRHPLEGPQFRQVRPVLRVRIRPEHLPGPLHERLKRRGFAPERLRPPLVRENRIARRDRDVAVDQRRTA